MALLQVDSLPLGATTTILGLVTVLIALRFAAGRKLHPDEPTVLPSWIPFIGHLIGMAVYGGRYIKKLGYVVKLASTHSLSVHAADAL